MLDIALLYKTTLSHKRSSMAYLVKGSHSFTCHPRVYRRKEWTIHCFAFQAEAAWSSFTDFGGMEGWVGLGATTASKQSAQDRYVTNIAVVIVQTVTPHCQLERWGQASNSWPFGPRATTLTSESVTWSHVQGRRQRRRRWKLCRVQW